MFNPWERWRQRPRRREDLARARQLEAQRRLFETLRAELAAGRLSAACTLGERLLDEGPFAEVYELLINLLDRDATGRTLALYDLLAEVEHDGPPVERPWRLYLRVLLLDRLGRRDESFVASAALVELPERYGWMRYDRANRLMGGRGSYGEARQELAATLRAAPSFWKAAAWSAETLLCQGREAEAFAAMDLCIRDIPRYGVEADVVAATVWRGELYLWTGQYARARADLDTAAESGLQLALGWRGACRLLTGDAEGALRDLQQATRLAADVEAQVWRGETHARLEEWDAAEASLSRAMELTPYANERLWALVARALVRAHRGDEAGFWTDFREVPARLVRRYEWQRRQEVAGRMNVGVGILGAMQQSARGLRRTDQYLIPLWLGRGGDSSGAPQC